MRVTVIGVFPRAIGFAARLVVGGLAMMVSRGIVMSGGLVMHSARPRFPALPADLFIELVAVRRCGRFPAGPAGLRVLLRTSTASLHESPFLEKTNVATRVSKQRAQLTRGTLAGRHCEGRG